MNRSLLIILVGVFAFLSILFGQRVLAQLSGNNSSCYYEVSSGEIIDLSKICGVDDNTESNTLEHGYIGDFRLAIPEDDLTEADRDAIARLGNALNELEQAQRQRDLEEGLDPDRDSAAVDFGYSIRVNAD